MHNPTSFIFLVLDHKWKLPEGLLITNNTWLYYWHPSFPACGTSPPL